MRSLFCRHQWKLLDKTVLPSPFEQSGVRYEGEVSRGTQAMCHRKAVVVTICCETCGKVKMQKRSNP